LKPPPPPPNKNPCFFSSKQTPKEVWHKHGEHAAEEFHDVPSSLTSSPPAAADPTAEAVGDREEEDEEQAAPAAPAAEAEPELEPGMGVAPLRDWTPAPAFYCVRASDSSAGPHNQARDGTERGACAV